MTYPQDPFKPSKGPSASTVGLAVLLASLMVGVAIVGWFLSPAANATETEHLSGLCEGLMETRIDALTQALNATGDEQTRQVNRAWAAERLYALEEC